MRANLTLESLARIKPASRIGQWNWLIHVVLILLSLFVIFPLVWAVITSFKQANEIYTLDIIPQHPTTDNYGYVYSAIPLGVFSSAARSNLNSLKPL